MDSVEAYQCKRMCSKTFGILSKCDWKPYVWHDGVYYASNSYSGSSKTAKQKYTFTIDWCINCRFYRIKGKKQLSSGRTVTINEVVPYLPDWCLEVIKDYSCYR